MYNVAIGVDGNVAYFNELSEELPKLFTDMNIKIKLFAKSNVPTIVENLIDNTDGEYICFLGDDTEPKMGFSVHALRSSNGKLVCFNDNIHEGRECQHWFAPKSLRDKLGGEFFHKTYNHVGCDNELMLKCMKLGLYHFEPNAYVYHKHFIKDICSDKSKVADFDECYSIGWNEENVKKDRELLTRRIKNNFISDDEQIDINIGSGSGSPKYLPEQMDFYLTLDKCAKADIQKDILEPGLFNDNTINSFLMEHVLEHFSSEDGEKVISTLYNALKPDGELELSVPDMGNIDQVSDKDYRLKVMYGWRIYGEAMFHRFGYTLQSLSELLLKYKFQIIKIEEGWEYDAPSIRILARK